MGAPAWGANGDQLDKASATVNSAALNSAGSDLVAGKIANELNAACACSDFTAQGVKDQRETTGLGWGALFIAERLALAISQQSKISFNAALNQVMTDHQQGMGWGAIGHANGLNVGKLVSDTVKSANAVANAADQSGKGQGQANAFGAGQHSSGQGVGAEAGHGGGGGQGGGGQGGGGGGAGGGGGGGGGKK
jgi:hypothetical protein